MSPQKRGVRTKMTKTTQGWVVHRGHIVKDDFGAYAFFTEQGSSTSPYDCCKNKDVVARLPGCDGQAADAVSAYSQVKLEDAPRLLNISKSECPDVWIRLPRHKWPKSWGKLKIPWYLLNETCTVIHLPDCAGKKVFQGYPPRRLKKIFSLRDVPRNRVAIGPKDQILSIWAKKKKKKKIRKKKKREKN